MKISTHRFWIVALLCIITPCTGWAQNVTLINTYTNPAPASGENFGYSIAAVGNDRVLIGVPYDSAVALNAGVAYLFSTNGTRLTTFTNPAPAWDDRFGYSLAAVGSDRVLVGAPADDAGADGAGAAYLFSTNGALLFTFNNPTPAAQDNFGSSVAAVGSDCVLIGAPYGDAGGTDVGEAYLFSTNGTLLTTFTNPTPASLDTFGSSVASVGSDRVLIGALGDDTGALGAGAAYLFNTNGTLLTTFTNPTPASSDFFGNSVTAVGSDRVLIGASGDSTGATSAGAAYLFSTTGTLLNTITNPTPAVSDYFGNAVTAMGNDRVLIGAYQDNTGATDAGAAYLYSAPPAVTPLLSLVNAKCVDTNFTFWFQTQSSTSYTVEYNGDLRTTNWTFVQTIEGDGSLWPCCIPMTNTAQCFFRVRQP